MVQPFNFFLRVSVKILLISIPDVEILVSPRALPLPHCEDLLCGKRCLIGGFHDDIFDHLKTLFKYVLILLGQAASRCGCYLLCDLNRKGGRRGQSSRKGCWRRRYYFCHGHFCEALEGFVIFPGGWWCW